MPTESEFLDAARFFDDAGDEVADVPILIADAFGSHVATGGQLTLEIDALILQTTGGCGVDNSTLEELAELCRERAQTVADYANAMNAWGYSMRNHSYRYDRWLGDVGDWEADPDNNRHPGQRPRPPVKPLKPAAWVDL